MNRIEFALGTSVLLLTALSIWLFNLGVIPSERYPGQATYGFASDLAVGLLLLLIFEGALVALHGIRSKSFTETVLGITIAVWEFLAFILVSVSIADGRAPYILAFPTPTARTSFYMLPGIFFGIALMLDALRKHRTVEQT